MARIKIYTDTHCSDCEKVKAIFDDIGWHYEELPLSSKAASTSVKRRSAPQIVINNRLLGGYSELQALRSANYQRVTSSMTITRERHQPNSVNS